MIISLKLVKKLGLRIKLTSIFANHCLVILITNNDSIELKN